MRKFKAVPGKGIVASRTVSSSSFTRNSKRRYIKSSFGDDFDSLRKMYTEPVELINVSEFDDTDHLSDIADNYGSNPIEYYFLASPGYYGYGGYGSDYSIYFWKLEDGRCIATSGYTGSEEFDSESSMINRIEEVQENMLAVLEELENEEYGDW